MPELIITIMRSRTKGEYIGQPRLEKTEKNLGDCLGATAGVGWATASAGRGDNVVTGGRPPVQPGRLRCQRGRPAVHPGRPGVHIQACK